jgi:pyruvate formate lyase activating enzyme
MTLESPKKKLNRPTVQIAQLSESVNGKIICRLCERRCLIAPGKRGFCGDRMNLEGTLYTLVYGNLITLENRPIEIKPFYHFHPGSIALTFAPPGCNLTCPWCQNSDLSRAQPDPDSNTYYPPNQIVARALSIHSQGLCASFTEPTLLFEYCLDLFPLARKAGLYTCFVSNGYMTDSAFHKLHEAGLDAIKIDIKGDAAVYTRYCHAEIEPIWRNVRTAHMLGMHVELVNLIIPGVNDKDSCLRDIIDHILDIDPMIPIHFTRYYPAYKFDIEPTPISTLEYAYCLAHEAALSYVYLGNVTGHRYENTYCPHCGNLLIERHGYNIIQNLLSIDKCPKCKEKIPIILK